MDEFIEKRCPNCGAILDDFGRCQFCGSKVYDFCDIRISPKTYIRIKTDDKIILAPVVTNGAVIRLSKDALPEMTIEFIVVGDMYMKKRQGD